MHVTEDKQTIHQDFGENLTMNLAPNKYYSMLYDWLTRSGQMPSYGITDLC